MPKFGTYLDLRKNNEWMETTPEHHATDHMMKSGQHLHVMIAHNPFYR